MQNYIFVKYFPETKEIVKYFMAEKYNNIEEISYYLKCCQTDPNLQTIKNGEKWFEVYMPEDFVIKSTREQLAELCESLDQSIIPNNALFAIVHQKTEFSVIWPLDISIEQRYSKIVQDHISKNMIF